MAARVLRSAVGILASKSPRVFVAGSGTGACAGTCLWGLLESQTRGMSSMARTLEQLPTTTSLYVNLPGTKGHTRVHADEHGKMSVTLESVQAEPNSYFNLRNIRKGLIVEKKKGSDGPVPAVKLEAHVPSHCCDVKVVSSGHVFVSELTQADLSVSSGGGDIKLGKIKANKIDASSSGGRITADLLTGSCDISSQGGDMHIKTAIGDKMRFESGGGSLNLSALYGQDLAVGSSGGPVIIEVLQVSGSSDISTSGGSVLIGGMDGGLTVTSGGGDVVVHMVPGIGDRAVEVNSQGGSVSVVLPLEHGGFDVSIRAKGGVETDNAIPLRKSSKNRPGKSDKSKHGADADDWIHGLLPPSTPLDSTPMTGKRSRSLAVVTDPAFSLPVGGEDENDADISEAVTADVGGNGFLRHSLRIDAGEGAVTLGQASWKDVVVARSARNEKRSPMVAAA